MTSFASWTGNLKAMADRFAAMRKKVCAIAEERRQPRLAEFERSFPFPLGLDLYTERPPSFQFLGSDSWYWLQGRRVVSTEERNRIIKDYYARRAAAILAADAERVRRAQGGG